MNWPIATDYQEAIQNPRLCFADADLKAGTVRVDRLGLPRPITGAFATVFQMDTPTGRWAVRCFLKHIDDHQRRYAAISNHLRSVKLKSAVGFDFVPQGIRIRSQWYPILKMEWVDGDPLNTYVTKNLGQPHRLLQLTRDWSEMMGSLRAAQIAHGDLQHGNILVTPSGLRLIDYDGMYVPSLSGCKSHEKGHRNYQHPKRDGHDFGSYLDNFSAWVIFCSVTCVALDPRLWQILNGGDECLLFRRGDFERPDRSRVFQVLESSRPEVKALAGQFRTLLAMPLRQVPALDGRIVSQPAGTPQRAASAGPVPDWLAGHVTGTRQPDVAPEEPLPLEDEHPAMVATADWIIDHLVDRQAPVPTLRAHSFVVERLALLLTLCVTAATGWTARVNFVPVMAGSVIIAVTVGALVVMLRARYRQVSGIKERRETFYELRAARNVLGQYLTETKSAESQRRKLLAPLDALEAEFRALPQKINEEVRGAQTRLDAMRASFVRKRQELGAEEAQAVRNVEQEARRRLGPLQGARNALDQKERNELSNGLRVLQCQHVERYLRGRTLDGEVDGWLPGIGPMLKTRLKAVGVYCASDVDERLVRSVKGIGDERALLLMNWRSQLTQIACASQPTSLPSQIESQMRQAYSTRRVQLNHEIAAAEAAERSQRQAVLDKFAQARTTVDQAERQVTATHEAAIQAIYAKLQRERVRIDAEYRALKAKLAPARKEQDQRVGELNRRTMQQRFEVCKLEKEHERYRGVSPGRYVAGIVGLRRAA
jgi:hypothetical protein